MRSRTSLLALPFLALLAGCSPERSVGPTDGGTQARGQLLECRADAEAETLTCAPPAGPEGAPGEGVFGDQGINIAMESKRVRYNGGTAILSADITVENLMAGPIGTKDGSTESSGVYVFVVSGPNADAGVVTINNADGDSAFTGSAQPYFHYGEVLASGRKSNERGWEFKFFGGASSFTFSVLVWADSPAQGAVQNWVLITGFGAPEAQGVYGFGTDGQVLFGDSGEVSYRVGGVWRSIYDTLAAPIVSSRSVFALAPNDIWSYVDVGGTRMVRRWDGGNWRDMNGLVGFPGQAAVGIGTTGAGNYWAFGAGLWRLLDTLWVADTLPTGATSFVGLAAIGADPFLLDDLGRVWLYHAQEYLAVAGVGSGDLGATQLLAVDTAQFWVVSDLPSDPEIRRYSAGGWSTVPLPAGYARSDGYIPAAGVALTDGTAFVVANNGTEGVVLRWDGVTWSRDHVAPAIAYTGAWARNPNEIQFSRSDGGLDVWKDGAMDPAHPATYRPDPDVIAAAWLSGEDQGYLVNEPGWIYRYAGGAPSVVDTAPVAGVPLSLWSPSVNDVWIAHGGTELTHYDGVSAEISAVPISARAVGGSGPNDVWAVGVGGAIAHFDGSGWSTVTLSCGGCEDWNGVWAASPSFAVAVGDNGQIGVWNGSWTVSTHGSADLFAVSGNSGSNAWAVGRNGRGWRWNGANWIASDLPTGNDLRGVWVASLGEAHAISEMNTFRWNGSSWAEMDVEQMRIGRKDNRTITGAGNDAFIGGARLFRGWR